MREILFRGKRLDNCEWVEGDLIHGYLSFEDTCIASIQIQCVNQVDPSTIGQFTGLTDKNGDKIFEGDILSYIYNNNDERKDIGKVEYSENHLGFVANNHFICFHTFNEVIGNLHDNPELLK